jgi:hypothetical protein
VDGQRPVACLRHLRPAGPRQGHAERAPPLHAVCNTQATSDGAYICTKSVTFPSETYNGANYQADASFTPLYTTSFTLVPLITFLCRTDI